MFKLLERFVVAVESIARDFAAMRSSQERYMEVAERQAGKEPQQLFEMFETLKRISGGQVK